MKAHSHACSWAWPQRPGVSGAGRELRCATGPENENGHRQVSETRISHAGGAKAHLRQARYIYSKVRPAGCSFAGWWQATNTIMISLDATFQPEPFPPKASLLASFFLSNQPLLLPFFFQISFTFSRSREFAISPSSMLYPQIHIRQIFPPFIKDKESTGCRKTPAPYKGKKQLKPGGLQAQPETDSWWGLVSVMKSVHLVWTMEWTSSIVALPNVSEGPFLNVMWWSHTYCDVWWSHTYCDVMITSLLWCDDPIDHDVMITSLLWCDDHILIVMWWSNWSWCDDPIDHILNLMMIHQ